MTDIDDAQPRNAQAAHAPVHHRHRIALRAHAAGAARVVHGDGRAADECVQRRVVFDALPGRQLVEHEITQRRLTHQVARDAHRIAHPLPVFLAGQEVLVDARRGQRIRARHRDAAPAARMQQDGAHGEAVLERLAPGLEPGPGRERRRRQQELQVGRVHALGLHEAHHPARHVAGETFAAQVGAHHRAADAVQPQLAHEGPGARRRAVTMTEMWSCRLAPTPGRSSRTDRPACSSTRAGPMPECIRMAGVLIAPAARMTSRRARASAAGRRADSAAPWRDLRRNPGQHMRAGLHAQVRPPQRRPQIGRGAAAPSLADRHLQAREAAGGPRVVVLQPGMARLPGRRREGVEQRILVAAALHAQGPPPPRSAPAPSSQSSSRRKYGRVSSKRHSSRP